MTYVMILTLFFNGGLSIQTAPMADKSACAESAKQWAQMVRNEFGMKAKWTVVCSPNVATAEVKAEAKPEEPK